MYINYMFISFCITEYELGLITIDLKEWTTYAAHRNQLDCCRFQPSPKDLVLHGHTILNVKKLWGTKTEADLPRDQCGAKPLVIISRECCAISSNWRKRGNAPLFNHQLRVEVETFEPDVVKLLSPKAGHATVNKQFTTPCWHAPLESWRISYPPVWRRESAELRGDQFWSGPCIGWLRVLITTGGGVLQIGTNTGREKNKTKTEVDLDGMESWN